MMLITAAIAGILVGIVGFIFGSRWYEARLKKRFSADYSKALLAAHMENMRREHHNDQG